MKLVNIYIKIDEQDKKDFNNLCNELGLSMTIAFKIFIKAMIRTGGFPFKIKKDILKKSENENN